MKTASPSSRTKTNCLDEEIQQQQQRMSFKNLGVQYERTRAKKKPGWVDTKRWDSFAATYRAAQSRWGKYPKGDGIWKREKWEKSVFLKKSWQITGWIKRMNVFHQDIATATNVIVRTDSTLHLGSRWKEALWFPRKTILQPLTTDQLPVWTHFTNWLRQ